MIKSKRINIIALIVIKFLLAFGMLNSISAKAELHPKIEEALNREVAVDGFIFDIQSSNPEYYEENLDYLKEQIDAIYDYSKLYHIVILSRGREIQSFLTINYENPVFKSIQSYVDLYGMEVEIDIEIAVSLGFHEGSFPKIIKSSDHAYVTIVSGRSENMIVIELERMSLQEKKQIRLSPTWRTDNID